MFHKNDMVVVMDYQEWGIARIAAAWEAHHGMEYLLEFPKGNNFFHDGVDPEYGVSKEDCPLGDNHYWWVLEEDIAVVESAGDSTDVQDLI